MKFVVTLSYIMIAIFAIGDSCTPIPSGKYLLVFDAKYQSPEDKKIFTLEDDKFVMTFPDKVENLQVEWIDDDSFVVKDYTESSRPSIIELQELKKYRPSFNIVKELNDEYHFVLGSQEKQDTIYFGKFVRSKK